MELRDLRALATVVELGGITRASIQLHLVQSAISQAVQRLERELGLELLLRRPGSGGVQPTEAGLALAKHARLILGAVGRAEVEMDEYRGAQRGAVRVGILSSAVPLILARLLRKVRIDHPGLVVSIHEASGPALLEDLRLGRLDMAIVFMPVSAEDMITVPLFESELAILEPPPPSRLRRVAVSASDLNEEGWISFPPEHPGRGWLDDLFATIDRKPHVAFEVATLGELKAYVEAGLGIAIAPLGAVGAEVRVGRLQALPLSPRRFVTLCCASHLHQRSKAVEAIQEALSRLDDKSPEPESTFRPS